MTWPAIFGPRRPVMLSGPPPPTSTGPAFTTGTSTTTSLTLNKPAGTVSGDLLTAFVAVSGSGAVTPPTGWTLYQSTPYTVGVNTYQVFTYYHQAGSSEPASYTFTGSAQNWLGVMVRAAQSGPPEAQNSSAGAGTTATAPSITTLGSNRLVLTGFAYAAGTFSAPSGSQMVLATLQAASGNINGLTVTYFTQPSAGATGALTGTLAPTEGWAAVDLAVPPTTISTPPLVAPLVSPPFDDALALWVPPPASLRFPGSYTPSHVWAPPPLVVTQSDDPFRQASPAPFVLRGQTTNTPAAVPPRPPLVFLPAEAAPDHPQPVVLRTTGNYVPSHVWAPPVRVLLAHETVPETPAPLLLQAPLKPSVPPVQPHPVQVVLPFEPAPEWLPGIVLRAQPWQTLVHVWRPDVIVVATPADAEASLPTYPRVLVPTGVSLNPPPPVPLAWFTDDGARPWQTMSRRPWKAAEPDALQAWTQWPGAEQQMAWQDQIGTPPVRSPWRAALGRWRPAADTSGLPERAPDIPALTLAWLPALEVLRGARRVFRAEPDAPPPSPLSAGLSILAWQVQDAFLWPRRAFRALAESLYPGLPAGDAAQAAGWQQDSTPMRWRRPTWRAALLPDLPPLAALLDLPLWEAALYQPHARILTRPVFRSAEVAGPVLVALPVDVSGWVAAMQPQGGKILTARRPFLVDTGDPAALLWRAVPLPLDQQFAATQPEAKLLRARRVFVAGDGAAPVLDATLQTAVPFIPPPGGEMLPAWYRRAWRPSGYEYAAPPWIAGGVVKVLGPFVVVAGALYCAGAVEADLQTAD